MHHHNLHHPRNNTKKQDQPAKSPISLLEKKWRQQKKRLSKIFENIKFRQENKLNMIAISPQVNHRYKNGNYKSIYEHSLKQNHPYGGKPSPQGGGFMRSSQNPVGILRRRGPL